MSTFKIALLMPIAEKNKWLTANKFMLNSEERSFYTLPLTIKNVVPYFSAYNARVIYTKRIRNHKK